MGKIFDEIIKYWPLLAVIILSIGIWRQAKTITFLLKEVYNLHKQVDYLTYREAMGIVLYFEKKGEMTMEEEWRVQEAKDFIADFEKQYKTPQN